MSYEKRTCFKKEIFCSKRRISGDCAHNGRCIHHDVDTKTTIARTNTDLEEAQAQIKTLSEALEWGINEIGQGCEEDDYISKGLREALSSSPIADKENRE